MDVFALFSVSRHVRVCADATLGNLRQLCLDVEHEGSKLFDVDALARAELVVKIRDHGSPDYLHLSRYLSSNGI